MRSHMLAPIVVVALSSAAHASIQYTLTDLSTLGGIASAPGHLNNNNQIAGSYQVSAGVNHIMIFQNGTITDLGTDGGSTATGSAVNSSGSVIGNFTASGKVHDFFYASGAFNTLPTFTGATASSVSDLNNANQAVGFCNGNGVGDHAVLYTPTSITDLGILSTGQTSNAVAINSSGQAVGTGSTASGFIHAVLFANHTVTDLGTLGSFNSSARDINDNGIIVGSSSVPGDPSLGDNQAMIYSAGHMTLLGTFGGSHSVAEAINNLNVIVGQASDANANSRAFIYQNNTMTDLNTLIDPASGWTLTAAFDINDNGLIIAQAVNAQNVQHSFLLTPVPEPATLALLAAAPILLTRRRK